MTTRSFNFINSFSMAVTAFKDVAGDLPEICVLGWKMRQGLLADIEAESAFNSQSVNCQNITIVYCPWDPWMMAFYSSERDYVNAVMRDAADLCNYRKALSAIAKFRLMDFAGPHDMASACVATARDTLPGFGGGRS